VKRYAKNMEDFCVSHDYTQRDPLLLLVQRRHHPPPPPRPSAAAAIGLKFHPKHATKKNKTKHIMKISHINVNIYDKTATSQQNSD
jgi:hypothetical protein